MSGRSTAFPVFAILTCAAALGWTVLFSCDGGEAASEADRAPAATAETPAAEPGARSSNARGPEGAPSVPGSSAGDGEAPAGQDRTGPDAPAETSPPTPAPRDTPLAQEKLPGDAAIDLAMRSRALGSQEVRYVIDGWFKGYAGVVNPLGWFARRVGDEDTYVVSFSFAGESLQRGWFFEVDVPAGRVTNVSGRSELEKKYELYECPTSEYEAAILGKKTAPGSNAGSQEPDQPLCVAG